MIYLKTGVGIELRGEDMLLASLQSNISGAAFTNFRRIPYYRQRPKEELRREIGLFFRSKGLGKDNIVLGIPRKDLILRYLDLPLEVEDNLKQVVQYQVQSFEPTEEERFYYDFVKLNGDGKPKRLFILLAMVRKALLDEYLQFLLDIGIRPTAVTGSSMALSNMFLRDRKDLRDKTFLLADLGLSSMELLALRRGSFAYSREVPKANNQRWGDLMLREVNDAISTLRLEPRDALEKILLTGESSEAAHADIGAVIPECELLKNRIDFQVPGEYRPRLQEAASCIGLAYTGMTRRPAVQMNLLPDALRVRRTRWAYVPTVVLGIVILALLAALGFHDLVQNKRLIRRLDQEILLLRSPVERVQSLKTQSDALEARIRALEDLLRRKDMNLEILRELTSILPADTFLTTYTYREGKVQMAGLSGSASDLLSKLEKSPLLKDVTQRGQISKDPQTGKERFSFEATLER